MAGGLDTKWKVYGESATSPTDNTQRKEVLVKQPKLENIIFIGSELDYNSFWLKMMFVGAAYFFCRNQDLFRVADRNTIAYVDKGYTHAEKLAIEQLKNSLPNGRTKVLGSSADVVSCFNDDRENYKIQDVAIFSHGLPSEIRLDYPNSNVTFMPEDLSSIPQTAFISDGRLFSNACRTGVTSQFSDGSDADESLAQKMSNHFKIAVHAYLRRTNYGSVLRDRADSERIVATLIAARKENDGSIIEIHPDHQALPHPGLGNGSFGLYGASKEGTKDYALWRKKGGLSLPTAAETPENLPSDYRLFAPEQ